MIKHGIETSSHSGARLKLGQLFIKTGIIDKALGRHYSNLFEKRHKGDYNDFYDYVKETVLRLFPISKRFIDRIEELIQT